MSAAARRLCRQFGVRAVPGRFGEMETASIKAIARLMEKQGAETMVWTLRVLTETNPANTRQLNCEVITAVNAVCRFKRWTSLGLAFLEAFDAIDLGELRGLATSSGLSAQPVWATMAAVIIDRLRPVLEPLVSKPAPVRAKPIAPSKRHAADRLARQLAA